MSVTIQERQIDQPVATRGWPAALFKHMQALMQEVVLAPEATERSDG